MILPERHFLTHVRARPQKPLTALRGIVVHWTANTDRGANALANRNYFNLGTRYASAHYVVDDQRIIQCIPDTEVGFHCGDKPLGYYKPAAQELMLGARGRTSPNFYTIGVEYCVNADGNLSQALTNFTQLVARLCLLHRIDTQQVYRHWDITGKQCPRHFLNAQDWERFKQSLAAEIDLQRQRCKIGMVTAPQLNVRPAPADLSRIRTVLDAGNPIAWDAEDRGWGRVADDAWVNLKFVKAL